MLLTKYTTWYFNIINAAQTREIVVNEYYEKHHINPKSLGGNNDKENLVHLTAREHFLCHWLLTKMCVSDDHRLKMQRALWSMSWVKKDKKRLVSSWQYSIAKKAIIHIQRTKIISQETRDRLSIAGKKRFSNASQRKLMSESQIKRNATTSDEVKSKISASMKAYAQDKEWTKRRADKIRGVPKKKVECPYCGKIGGINVMGKYHFDNCKLKVKSL